jgi:hypothetical protein
MALDPNITLKIDDNSTTETFNKVDQLPGQTGTKRSSTTVDVPDSKYLLIRSQAVGKGANKADKHSISLYYATYDASGNLITGNVTLSLTFPQSSLFTDQMMVDMTHQVLDLVVATSSFDVDNSVIQALLRGES